MTAGFAARLNWAELSNRSQLIAVRERPTMATRGSSTQSAASEDLQIIEELLALALEAIGRKTPDVRLADVLKLLEFKHKLTPEVDVRRVFAEWIEKIKKEQKSGLQGSSVN